MISYYKNKIVTLSEVSKQITLISGVNYKNFFFFNISSKVGLYLMSSFSKVYIFKVMNTLLSRSVNNYYSSDFFVKNSRVMSMAALKILNNNFSVNSLKNNI